MANYVQFAINDTSPTLFYSPFGDTLSTPNLSAGWNPYYTLSGFATVLGEVGNGTSLHITSNNGSFVLLQWNGTGIQLYGMAISASYSIALDGRPFKPAAPADNVLATITDLPDTLHTLVLTAIIPAAQDPPNSSVVMFHSAVITSCPEPPNVSFTSQTVNDNDVAFLGRWSFDTASTGASFHSSRTLGDRAITSFNGTTFLLQGITSPDSGNYTVTLDNVTTILSAQSSFTSYNSLLFYATGLDPTSTHLVQVSNSGGSNLSLLVGGFNTFVPYSTQSLLPLQGSPIPAGLASGSFPRGTIAALALAGILAFLILSGLVYYFLFYRLRKRRRRALTERKRRSPKEYESGVLDISPVVDKSAELGSPIDLDQRDNSLRNGFSRWIRGAVDGSPGELSLPIRFRHSGSFDEKFPNRLNEVPLDDLSDLATNSSAKRKAKTKNKGKARQLAGRSWSTGRMFDISRRRSRRRSSMQNLSRPPESISTFLAAEPTSLKGGANPPPSYAASVSVRDSKSTTNGNSNSDPPSDRSMPSVPRSVSPFPGDDASYPPQKDHTGAFLLPHGDSHFEHDSSVGSSSHKPKPPLLGSSPIGQSNAVEDKMDTLSPLETLEKAIKSFSPRTFRHPYANQDEDSIQMSPAPQDVDFALLTASNDDDVVEVRDGVFLSVNQFSPFQLNFDTINSNSGELSYLSTSSLCKPTGRLSGCLEPPNPEDARRPMSASSDFLQGSSNMQLRLTPVFISSTPPAVPPSSTTSFLDFNSSREGSLTSRSVKTTWSEERQRGIVFPVQVEEKSRWSDTTVPSMQSKRSNNGNSSNRASGNGSSDSSTKNSEPRSLQSSTFPIPIRVSIPSSSYGNATSGRHSLASGLTRTASDNVHVHPTFESLESPTESIPMSAVSELLFRQSVSEETTGSNSRRTTESSLVFVSSHPPLPARHDDFMPRPFDPSILISRVLGLSSPTSTMTARGHSSISLSSPRPYASSPNLQYITNIRADRPYSQNSVTDSSGQ